MLPCSACILACAVAAALAITWCWCAGAPAVVMLLRDRQPALLPPPPLGVGDFFWYGLKDHRPPTRANFKSSLLPITRLRFVSLITDTVLDCQIYFPFWGDYSLSVKVHTFLAVDWMAWRGYQINISKGLEDWVTVSESCALRKQGLFEVRIYGPALPGSMDVVCLFLSFLRWDGMLGQL